MMRTHYDPKTGRVSVSGVPDDPAERKIAAAEEFLRIAKEMFDDAHLGVAFDFDTWVDQAPVPEGMRPAIAEARARGIWMKESG